MTRESSARIPSYRLHKPTGRAVVRLDGRDFYLGEHGSEASEERYRRVIAEWLANGKRVPPSGRAGSLDDLSMSSLVWAFLEHAKRYYVKNGTVTGEYSNIRDALRPVAELYMNTPVKKFGAKALKTVREEMIKAGLSRRVINSRINRIRRMFKWGVENELANATALHTLQAVSPLRNGRSAARELGPVKPVPDEWIDAVLVHVSRQVAAMIELQRLTGMRPGEVTAMRSCDLDTSGKIWLYTPESHKTEHHGKNRQIYLGPKAQEVLKPFLKRELDQYLFSPREAVAEWRAELRRNRKSKVTPSQKRRKPKSNPKRIIRDRYTTNSYIQAIYRGCRQAFPPPDSVTDEERKGWEKEHRWSPNRLRHNAATFLRKEFGIEAARVVLGHSSSVVTEVYAELDHRRAADIMERVG